MDQLELLDPSEVADDVALAHGAPYRPGTSHGYCHVPIELAESGVSNQAFVLFVRILIDESLGQATPEAFFADEHAVAELIGRRMIEPDGNDWRIFEPNEWRSPE